MKIYHNPRCSKSRQTLDIIRQSGAEPEIIQYLKTPPTADELHKLLGALKLDAEQIIRKGEKLYKEKFKGKKFDNDTWIRVLVENPTLIERPIVVKGEKAVLGRPPENVNQLL